MSRSVICDALTCAHNRHHQCDAANIQVRPSRSPRGATYCNTFSYQPHGEHTNGVETPMESGAGIAFGNATANSAWLSATGVLTPMPYIPEIRSDEPPKVSCSATACVFNDNYRCGADPLHINDPNTPAADPAPCGTFRRI